jgi:predicted dehydrogenase
LDDGQVHLGIVGLGNWSRQTFAAVGQLPDVNITACYSRYPDTREVFATEYGCKACERCEDMVEDPRMDGIVVMSSNAAHEKDVTLAASGGKHVLVTKPIATTIAAGKRMIAACDKNEVILAVGHQTRREPAIRRLKEVLDSGELGDVRLVEANYSTPNGLKIEQGDWRYTEDECPGGALIQIGIHVIDSLLYLFGPVGWVLSWQDRGGLRAEIGGEAALHNLAVVLAAVESDRLSKPVEIASLLEESEAR